ncbi:MAG: Uma2 family endonuclease [Alphaproteobacteria bacterium]
MAEPAVRKMAVDEFLRWDDGTDTRYELVGGSAVAMAPPSPAHGRLALALGSEIRAALRTRPPCFVQSEAGIVRPDRDDTCYIADLAVSCEELRAEDRMTRQPILIVEVLSPTTSNFDRQTKVADYRQIPSVREILLIDSQTMFAEILRRDGDRWITEIVQGPAGILSLSSVPLGIRMSDLYEGIPLPDRRGRGVAESR